MTRFLAALVCTALLFSGAPPPPPVPRPKPMAVSFYGAPWIQTGPSSAFFHAFICISYYLRSSLKEDCYGFYPKGGKKAAAIGGPGKIDLTDIRRTSDRAASTKGV